MSQADPPKHRLLHRYGPPWGTSGVAILLGLLLVSCSDDGPAEPEPNEPPTASISAPSNGALYVVGEEISFEGSAQDPEDGALGGGSLVWESDRDGQLGTGTAFTREDLTPGDHTITLTATDSEGDTGTDSVEITVSEPPMAAIDTPEEGASFGAGAEVTFQGSGEAPSGDALTGDALAWTSDLDGELGIGEEVARDDLSSGEHEIVLTATDSQGLQGADTVTITVLDPPNASIEAPEEGSTHWSGSEVAFQGSAEDAEGLTLEGDALVWDSDRDGEVGVGASFTLDDLSTGGHTITLTATDTRGAEATDEIAIAVALPSIKTPEEGSLFPEGAEVRLEASVPEPGGEPLDESAIVWESDRDGSLGTGRALATTDLSVGSHRITLTATGPGGVTASAETEIDVTAPFMLEGTLHPLPGRTVPPLEVRTASGSFEGTTDVAGDGTFEAAIPEPGLLDSLVVQVDALDPEERTHFPIHINFGGTVPESVSWLEPDVAPDTVIHHVQAALVPLTWTIEDGPHAGEEVELSLDAAGERALDGLSFIFAQDVGTLVDAAWHEDLLPLPVAFHHDSTDVPITESDSVAFWDAVDELQENYGETLFEPTVIPPGEDTFWLNRGTVRVDTTLSAVAAATPYWSRRIHDVGTAGQVSLHTAVVQFRELDGFQNEWLVKHEMAHALGLGHTCAWESILGGSSSGCPGADPSLEDVAHEQVKRAVANLRFQANRSETDRIMFGLEYSRTGERVVLMGLPPYRDPEADAVAQEGVRPVPGVEVLGREGDVVRGRFHFH